MGRGWRERRREERGGSRDGRQAGRHEGREIDVLVLLLAVHRMPVWRLTVIDQSTKPYVCVCVCVSLQQYSE